MARHRTGEAQDWHMSGEARDRHRTGKARDYLAMNGEAQDYRLCHYRREGEGVDIRGRHSVIIDFGRSIASKPLRDPI